MPPLHSPTEDEEHFGTVTATLAAEPIRISANVQESAAFQFGIETQPLAALLTFEIANPRIDAAPEIYLNGEDIGPVSLALPELADSSYRGEMQSVATHTQLPYTRLFHPPNTLP